MTDTRVLRQQALTAAQAGDRERAYALLDTLLREDPRDDQAWLLMASLTDSQDQALAYLSRALVVNPGNERARAGIAWMHEVRLKAEAETRSQIQERLQRGHDYLDRGQVDAAVWEFEGAIRGFPDSAELHANLAVAYYQQSRWAEAVRELEMAVRLQPDYADAYYSLGVLHEATGNQDRALAAWEQVLQLAPDHADARRRLFQHGRLASEKKPSLELVRDVSERCPHCNGALTGDELTCPHCQHVLFHVCPNCQALVEDGRQVCPSCRKAMPHTRQRSLLEQLEPGQSMLDTLRRIEAEARPTEGEEMSGRRSRLRPRVLILFLPPTAFWLLLALTGFFGLLFGLNPTWLPSNLFDLGRAIQAFAVPLPIRVIPRQMLQYAPAVTILLGLFMLSGTAVRVKWAFYANLILSGVLLLSSLVDMFTGQYTVVALIRVIMLAGVVALTLFAADEYEEGELSRRIASSPRDAKLYHNRGLIYYKRGQLDEAIAELNQAIRLNPSDLATRNLLGLALADRGRFEDALEQLEVARRIDPANATTLGNIHDVQESMQQRESEARR